MRIPIIIPTSRESFKPWIKIVGVILIALGIWVTVSNVDFKEAEFVPEGAVAFSDMNKTDVYETTDMVVFDKYATYEPNYTEYHYYLVGIWEDDETLKYATLITDASQGMLYTELEKYYRDTTAEVGDCRFALCYTVTKLSSQHKDIQKFYDEIVEDYNQYYDYESTGLVLHYACDSSDDFIQYKEEAAKDNKTNIILAAALILGGIICISIGFILSNNDKKKAMAYVQANAQYYNPQQTGTYYQPEALNQNTVAEPVQQEYAPAEVQAVSEPAQTEMADHSDDKTEG